MTSHKPKTVCIVGAGISGLVALKECLHEGLQATCFELDSTIGGIRNQKPNGENSNTPMVWDSLITNTSKYMTSYSDFPTSPEVTPYMTWRAMFEYCCDYAKHFNLHPSIKFHTRVVKIRKTSDPSITGRWDVFTCQASTFRDGDNKAGKRVTEEEVGKLQKQVFDFVLVCSGYFKLPTFPDVKGLDTFPGTIQHAGAYKSPKQYDGKKVLIVGNSFSAGDIANDIGNLAKQVYLALGQGTWILPRLSGGLPGDLLLSRKTMNSSTAEEEMNNEMIKESQKQLDHIDSGICPPAPPMESPNMFGDGIYVKIMSNRIQTYGRLTSMEGSVAHFGEGNKVSDVDALVCCTGYKPDLSFLDLDVVQENGKLELFKMILPLNEEHHTLGFIGFFGVDSATAPMSELQSRYVVKLFAGKLSLPSKEEMKRDVDFWNYYNFKRKKRYSYYLPALDIQDTIAKLLGAYPNFWTLFFKDPVLAYRVWYGPMFSAHYRLLGPDSDFQKAREISHRAYKEACQPLRHRPVQEIMHSDVTRSTWSRGIKVALIAPAVAVACYFVMSQVSK